MASSISTASLESESGMLWQGIRGEFDGPDTEGSFWMSKKREDRMRDSVKIEDEKVFNRQQRRMLKSGARWCRRFEDSTKESLSFY